MALEIERRFLVRGDQWRQYARPPQEIQQGYLASGTPGLTLRVRLARPQRGDPQAFLTLKLPGGPAGGSGPAPLDPGEVPPPPPLARLEFEYPIPMPDGEDLLACCPHRLAKVRWALDLPGGDWVLDVFAAANAPLVVAEVELERTDQPVPVPSWCFREITARADLSNAALARHPLEAWPAVDRDALWA